MFNVGENVYLEIFKFDFVSFRGRRTNVGGEKLNIFTYIH